MRLSTFAPFTKDNASIIAAMGLVGSQELGHATNVRCTWERWDNLIKSGGWIICDLIGRLPYVVRGGSSANIERMSIDVSNLNF